MNKFRAVAFDLDGTIYFGNSLAKGARQVISILEKRGVKIFYFTNNSTRTRSELRDKLINFGLQADLDNIYNCSYASSLYLKEHNIMNVCCIGTEGLQREVALRGVNITGENAEAVLVGKFHFKNAYQLQVAA